MTDSERETEEGADGTEEDQSDGSALVNGKPPSTSQYEKYMGRDAVKDRRKGTCTVLALKCYLTHLLPYPILVVQCQRSCVSRWSHT
jgi:hypothetical protein